MTSQLVSERERAGGATPGALPALVGVEWLRLRSRRAFWALALLAFLGVALSVTSYARDAQPPSASEIAAAEEMAEQEAAQPWVQEEVDRCEEVTPEERDAMYGPGFACEDIRPRAENYYYVRPVDFVDDARDALLPATLMFALAAVLLGATFAGADWAAGTIGTQLVFEPRRGRLFVTKTVVVGLALAVVAAVAMALSVLAVYVVATRWGSVAGAGAAAGDLVLAGLRGMAVVVAAGAGGVAVALALRRSIAVLGLLTAYLFVGEGLLRGVWAGIEQWLVSARMAAWLQGGFDIMVYPDACNLGPCEPTVTHVSTLGGGVYLAVGTALLLAVSYAVFARRDVA